MAEIKTSEALAFLLEKTKQYSLPQGTLSTDGFLIALCEFVDSHENVFQREREAVRRIILKEVGNALTIADALFLLSEAKKDGKAGVDYYFHIKLFEARQDAKEQKADMFLPEHLALRILREPTKMVRTWLDDIKQGSGGERPDVLKTKDDPRLEITALTKQVTSIREKLRAEVLGQEYAISVFTEGIFESRLKAEMDKQQSKPMATFLFAGPPGVGKTFLAEQAAKLLELPFKRFDMSEYSDKEANLEFAGSDKVYKNGKCGNVTGFVADNPKCVLLFDEIEKAHLSVIHLFLQVLDAGRLRDNFTDAEVSFADAILIFTTNAGKQLYEQSESGVYAAIPRKVILRALQEDRNPLTGNPYFPPAICSRFASSNVVMFNHIGAHDLWEIARREILKGADLFEKKYGITVNVEESVFSAILFEEGGTADARTIRSRANKFLHEELFELFRLIGSGGAPYGADQIDKIIIHVELPDQNQDIMSLFKSQERPKVLVFCDKDTARICQEGIGCCEIAVANSLETVEAVLKSDEIQIALIDSGFGKASRQREFLNFEDEDSASRDVFRMVREYYPDLPVYLLETSIIPMGEEERVSFYRQGIQGFLNVRKPTDVFLRGLQEICERIHQQNSIMRLARTNKTISFESSQKLMEKGGTAEIRLFDFRLITAVDAEDSENILGRLSRPDISFDEIIGASEAKEELRYFVDYLKEPRRFKDTGVRPPKGVLLYGPPGTGKTMLAKAMAHESDVTFLAAEGNQFLQKYVGEGKDQVHQLFRTAQKYAPSILFVDEIDAIARERQGGENASANGEDVLTAFLAEMDGFKTDSNRPVFVLAATNYDVNPGGAKSLDPALMRRFDRRIRIDLPNREERNQYIKIKIANNKFFDISESAIDNLALRSTGMSLAEMESVFELALRSAIRIGTRKVTDAAIEEAFETFNNGERKKWDAALLERVAYHEAGHAYVCWKSGETPSYLTIVARGNHGGYMQHGDQEGKAVYTREELLSKIRTSLGGRASEIVRYGKEEGLTTGVSGDLESATRIAKQMICSYGMDPELGPAVIDSAEIQQGGMALAVREGVNRILKEQMDKTIGLVEKGQSGIRALVQALVAKDHLTGLEIETILRQTAEME